MFVLVVYELSARQLTSMFLNSALTTGGHAITLTGTPEGSFTLIDTLPAGGLAGAFRFHFDDLDSLDAELLRLVSSRRGNDSRFEALVYYGSGSDEAPSSNEIMSSFQSLEGLDEMISDITSSSWSDSSNSWSDSDYDEAWMTSSANVSRTNKEIWLDSVST